MPMEQPESVERAADEIARWLIGEARVTSAPLDLIDGFCRRLVDCGVPLWRLRAGQRLANPLASAWGVIWTRDGSDTHEYLVPRTMLSTGAYYGSPFQYVIEHRRTFRRRLIDLHPERDHEVLHEMAARGRHRLSGAAARVWRWLRAGHEPRERRRGRLRRLAPRADRAPAPAAGRRARARRHAPLERQPAAHLPRRRPRRCGARGRDQARRPPPYRSGDPAGRPARLHRHERTVRRSGPVRRARPLFRGGGRGRARRRRRRAEVPGRRHARDLSGSRRPAAAPPRAPPRCARSSVPGRTSPGPRRPTARRSRSAPLCTSGRWSTATSAAPTASISRCSAPAVNLVGRLEGLAKQLDRATLCSAAFARELDAPLASLGRFPMKGVAEAQEVFAPDGDEPRAGS